MRVMILDDDEARHDAFRRRLATCVRTHVYTAAQAIRELQTGPHDLVCLDHDLDLNDPIEEPGDGTDVAEFIAHRLDPRKYPRQVLVHSWNAPAGKRMSALIRGVGIPVVEQAFCPSLHWLVLAGQGTP